MRHFRVVFILLFSISSFAQPDSIEVIPERNDHTAHYGTLNVSYGKAFRSKTQLFQEYFGENYNSDFGTELEIFSLNIHTPLWFGRGSSYNTAKGLDSNFGLNFRRTNKFTASDTSDFQMQMFDFHFALGLDPFFFSKKFDLPVRIGTAFGITHLKVSEKNYRNPYFDLILQMEPRIVIWKFAVGIRGEMGFDITSKKWKPKLPEVNNSIPFRNHYASIVVSLGYRIH